MRHLLLCVLLTGRAALGGTESQILPQNAKGTILELLGWDRVSRENPPCRTRQEFRPFLCCSECAQSVSLTERGPLGVQEGQW